MKKIHGAGTAAAKGQKLPDQRPAESILPGGGFFVSCLWERFWPDVQGRRPV